MFSCVHIKDLQKLLLRHMLKNDLTNMFLSLLSVNACIISIV